EVDDELRRGRDTVVMALGATEQHGAHMPLATDALLGDHLAWEIAERLGAFVAPTLRFGCSEHHLAFPGTISIAEDTFHAVVADVARSFAAGGFRRLVLLPTHGGNFAPLARALEKLGPHDGLEIRALTDIGALLAIAQLGADEHGVPMSDGGLHAGEWETSMLAAIHPQLEHADRRSAGFTGDPEQAVAVLFDRGVETLSSSGVLGDPTRASAAHGKRYWERVIEIVLERVG
ncbi:MAG: creatininase family protein, partial [Solirubrobacteraceae bacterium]